MRPTSPWLGPRRTPPARVTTSDAPTMRIPGVGSPMRPPSITRNGPDIVPASSAVPVALAPDLLEPELERLVGRVITELEKRGGGSQTRVNGGVGCGAGMIRDVEERREW